MHGRRVVVGQHVQEGKVAWAREMRREMTDAEQLLWRALRGNQVSGLHFRRQQVIDGFIVDFYCHAAGLVVEVDGGIHQAQADADAERDRILTARGLRILRLTNEEIRRDLAGALARIAEAALGRT